MAEQIVVLDLENGVYVSDNININGYNYGSKVSNLFFDGEKPKPTFKQGIYQVEKMPEKVQQQGRDRYENVRWELKSGYPTSELTPQVVYEDITDDESEYYEVRGLYEKKFELVKGELEDVECEFTIYKGGKLIKEDFQVKYNLLDEIQTPNILLPNKPCRITGEEFYKIIRQTIKTNLDGRYAKITSDYDFCLTVQKVIEAHEPIPYIVDIGTKRKPNKQTRYQPNKTFVIFESAPKPYQSYTVQEGLSGENYEDLSKKIKDYLDNLIKIINEPVKECSCCKGRGVVQNEIQS